MQNQNARKKKGIFKLRNSIFTFSISDVISFGSFFVGLLTFLIFTLGGKLTLGAFVSILVIIGVDKGAELLIRRERDQKLNENFEKLNKKLDIASCIYRGRASTALYYVLENLKRAHTVYNTYISCGVAHAFSYDEEAIDALSKGYFDFLSKGGLWVDVISDPSGKYYKEILMGKDRNDVQRENRGIQADRKGAYIYNEFKSNFPSINFIILEYGGGDREVFFGWGHHKSAPIGNVFSSTKDTIVSMFDDLLETMRDNSVSIEKDPPKEKSLEEFLLEEKEDIRIREIEGDWMNIALDKQGNVLDVALLSIYSENGGEIAISGNFYYKDTELGQLSSKTAKWDGKSLWWVHQKEIYHQPEKIGFGASHYKFIREGSASNKFYGKFYDKGLGKDIYIYGERLGEEDHNIPKEELVKRKAPELKGAMESRIARLK